MPKSPTEPADSATPSRVASAARRLRESWSHSVRENIREYRTLVGLFAPAAAVLWPVYGLFCSRILGLREDLGLRVVLALGCALVWLRVRVLERCGQVERLLWLAHAVVGLGWLPWHLYLANQRATYWQMSTVCFAVAFPIAVRGVDLLPGLAATALLVAITDGFRLGSPDIPVLGVVVFALWLVAAGTHILRKAHLHIEAQAELLERQNERLRELDRSKDEFTANVAHDLRTPLTVALSLAEDMARETSPTGRGRLDALSDALHLLHRQSEELLDFERLQLGVFRLDRRKVDLRSWLRRFEEGFRSLARARGLDFRLSLPATALWAEVDPVRLETALFNLVSNAFKFTPSGGLVEIGIRPFGESGAALWVQDEGEGIPGDALGRIFDRFQQVDRGPGTYTHGAGIGLSLVKTVAEAHGGRVEVRSAPGRGSRFELVLEGVVVDPILEPVEAEAPPVHRRPVANDRLMLVAEDQPMLLHLLHEVLGKVGPVALASDGLEALEKVRELEPDLLVTDNQMPGMDGLDLIATLRADPVHAGLPIILLTGEPHLAQRRLGPDSDVVVVEKPFQQSELLDAVRRILSRTGMFAA
jgi:signal transduction histidine kinase/CheY-like chemotaxis protein